MNIAELIKENLPSDLDKLDSIVSKIEKAINKELPLEFVAKDQYNKKVLELADTQKELKTAQADGSAGEAWQKKYEAEVEAHTKTKAEHEAEKKGEELKKIAREALIKAGAREDIVDDFMLTTIDLTAADYLEKAKEKYGKYFSTETQPQTQTKGADVGTPPANTGGEKNPWIKGEGFDLEKQTALFRKDPAAARKMAEAAKIRL